MGWYRARNCLQQGRQWLRILVLILLIGLALSVRWPDLGLAGLSNDEVFSWRLTTYPTAELIPRTAADLHPPLYYLLLKGWSFVCGSSPDALRALSVFFGVLSVPTIYLFCSELGVDFQGHHNLPRWARRGGALLSALLLAIHASQVTPARTARMYSLGVFLAGVTSLLLLRALRARQNRGLWWAAYGLAITAFCYTHYYAFFTVAAQGMFVAGYLFACAWRRSFREMVAPATGFLLAGTLSLLLYIPWLPVCWAQIRAVHHSYSIPPVEAEYAEEAVVGSSTGLEYTGPLAARIWLATQATLMAWTLRRAGGAAWCCLLQVVVPWTLSLGISAFGARSIFLERYLVFAQFFLLAYWGLIWCYLPNLLARVWLAAFLVVACLCGLDETARRLPSIPPPVAQAAEFLRLHHETGDLILVDAPSDVNRLRYYAMQAGVGPVEIRCPMNPLADTRHFTHVAALSADDLFRESPGLGTARRLWRTSGSGRVDPNPPAGMKVVFNITFWKGNGNHYSLVLFDPLE